MATRRELVEAIGERYRASCKGDRSAILNEFVAVTGYHRKHAIRLLRPAELAGAKPPRRYRRSYGEPIRAALISLWEASDRICSKRLKPLIPILLPALEHHGRLDITDEVRAALLRVSAATMDRLLADIRMVARGGRRRRAGFSSAVRRSVPVRTFGDWNDPVPGFLEIDMVAHSGTSAAGSFVQTVVMTDIATGWTECIPVVVRDGGLVIETLKRARTLLPFPMLGVDFDNDGAFMNEPLVSWCREQGFEVTRSRAYHKNDQAWVEQKNGAIVRRLVGYGRLEGVLAADALVRLYAAARLHTNLFQPSFKLREKTRIGARVIKRYHPPLAPAMRVLAHPAVNAHDKGRLRALLSASDPVLLIGEVRAAQADLGRRIDRRGAEGAREATTAIDLATFTTNLKTAWQHGEQRPTHRRPYHRRKPVPRRPSMLDDVSEQVTAWLERQPAISALEILTRLIAKLPDRFNEKHLRTVQRAVRAWRGDRARAIIMAGAQPIPAELIVNEADPPPPDPHPRGSSTWVHRNLPRSAPPAA